MFTVLFNLQIQTTPFVEMDIEAPVNATIREIFQAVNFSFDERWQIEDADDWEINVLSPFNSESIRQLDWETRLIEADFQDGCQLIISVANFNREKQDLHFHDTSFPTTSSLVVSWRPIEEIASFDDDVEEDDANDVGGFVWKKLD